MSAGRQALVAGLAALIAGGPRDTFPRSREPVPAACLVAVGDVHGDFETFRKLLFSLGIIDREDRWAGGDRVLVQTGDLLDRGAGSRRVIDLLMALEKEAPAAGGRVVALLGNHEVMNVAGDLRYTLAGEFAAYKGEEPADLRERRKSAILDLIKKGCPLLRSGYYAELGRFLNARTFDRHYPPGFFAHREAFSPSGKYGRWILERPALHREAGTVFLHAGLSRKYARLSIEELNKQLRSELLRFLAALGKLEKLGAFDPALGLTELQYLLSAERRAGGPAPELREPFAALESVLTGILFDEDGPLWYRGLALEQERTLRPLVDQLLSVHGVERVVVGHTQPRALAIEGRLGGKVFVIDTGLNQAVYMGKPSALLLPRGGGVRIWQ